MINTPEPRLELLNSDQISPTWMKLKLHIEKRIEQLRKENDGDRTELETSKLRGRIAELKALLALDK